MATGDPLALTEEQRALRDTVRGFLADQLPSAALRGALTADPGYSPGLHARLARELGLAGLTIPAEFGGLGLGPAEACVVHTELGHALYPGPLLASGLAAGALLAAGDPVLAGHRRLRTAGRRFRFRPGFLYRTVRGSSRPDPPDRPAAGTC